MLLRVLHAGRGRFTPGVLTASLAIAVVLAGAPSCSSSSTSGAPDAAAPPPCPDSFALANGGACSVAGQSCDLLAPCGAFGTPVTCVCGGGVFACSATIFTSDAGDAGPATSILATPDASTFCLPDPSVPKCPASEPLALEATCSDFAQTCIYPSVCPSVPGFDQCRCMGPLTTTDGPHYECTRGTCDEVDSGPASIDAATDAAGDSGHVETDAGSTGAPDSASDAPSDAGHE